MLPWSDVAAAVIAAEAAAVAAAVAAAAQSPSQALHTAFTAAMTFCAIDEELSPISSPRVHSTKCVP